MDDGRLPPFEKTIPFTKLEDAAICLRDMDNRHFLPETAGLTASRVYYEAASLNDATGKMLAVKRGLIGFESIGLPTGVYWRTMAPAMPIRKVFGNDVKGGQKDRNDKLSLKFQLLEDVASLMNAGGHRNEHAVQRKKRTSDNVREPPGKGQGQQP